MDWINIGKNVTIAVAFSLLITTSAGAGLLVGFAIFAVILMGLAIGDEIMKDSYAWAIFKDVLLFGWIATLMIALLIDLFRRR